MGEGGAAPPVLRVWAARVRQRRSRRTGRVADPCRVSLPRRQRPLLPSRSPIGRGRSLARSPLLKSRPSRREGRGGGGDPALLTQLRIRVPACAGGRTAESSYLPRSEAALRRSQRFGVEDSGAVLGLASLPALIRHEFAEALRYGPWRGAPAGLVADRTETPSSSSGTRYDEALEAFERDRAPLRPSLCVPTRASRMRASSWVTARARFGGDGARARLGCGTARADTVVRASSSQSSSSASDDPPLRAGGGPRSPPFPDTRAPASSSRGWTQPTGRLAAATREARRAQSTAIPHPTGSGVARALERTGHRAEARRQRATTVVIHRLLEANGVQVTSKLPSSAPTIAHSLPDGRARARCAGLLSVDLRR